nr:unnamed protein product [Callosobruchus analis]
MGPRPSFGIL